MSWCVGQAQLRAVFGDGTNTTRKFPFLKSRAWGGKSPTVVFKAYLLLFKSSFCAKHAVCLALPRCHCPLFKFSHKSASNILMGPLSLQV